MTKVLSIDGAGRIVIPQAIRQMFGLSAGATLMMETTERAVVLRPVEQHSAVVRENGVLVYEGAVSQDSLLDAIAVERDTRASAVWGKPV